jgi:hypothetical protein
VCRSYNPRVYDGRRISVFRYMYCTRKSCIMLHGGARRGVVNLLANRCRVGYTVWYGYHIILRLFQ